MNELRELWEVSLEETTDFPQPVTDGADEIPFEDYEWEV